MVLAVLGALGAASLCGTDIENEAVVSGSLLLRELGYCNAEFHQGDMWRPVPGRRFDVIARIHGGGITGQAGALRLGVARCLNAIDVETNRPTLKKAGLRTFDAWAHHPYYGNPSQTPSTRKVGSHTVGLGNIGALIREETRLFGRKPLWITEYGYQTDPPDPFFGVSWTKQAVYLRQAYEIAHANPRIDLFTWFLLDDSPSLDGWQSGLRTVKKRDKPVGAASVQVQIQPGAGEQRFDP